MAPQVVILRAVRSLAPHLARLKNATKALFNGLLSQIGTYGGSGGVVRDAEVASSNLVAPINIS